MLPVEGQDPPESQGGDNAPQDDGGGQRYERLTAPQIAGRRATWTIGLIPIPLALVFFALLAFLWPPPKPREGLTLGFERQDVEVSLASRRHIPCSSAPPRALPGRSHCKRSCLRRRRWTSGRGCLRRTARTRR